MDEQRLVSFLESLRQIDWLAHAGEPCDNARAVENIQAGWDREGKRMLAVWGPRTHALEVQAQRLLGDQNIDRIFSSVSETIHERLYQGICSYLDRVYNATDEKRRGQRSVDESLYPELMDSVKRDVCWSAVEHMLLVHGFFSNLLGFYQQGRWPCSWDGEYPEGQGVIL